MRAVVEVVTRLQDTHARRFRDRSLFNTLGLVWLTCYALAAARGRAVLQRPRIRTLLDYLSGTVLIGLGIRVALERRQ